jgi:hypothetical protein
MQDGIQAEKLILESYETKAWARCEEICLLAVCSMLQGLTNASGSRKNTPAERTQAYFPLRNLREEVC